MENVDEIRTEAEALEATGRDWHVLAEIPLTLRTEAVCRTTVGHDGRVLGMT